MRRRIWFEWHSWLGINLSVLMIFVLFTGTLATVSKEIDWLFNPAMGATVIVSEAELPWGAMLINFRSQYPDAEPRHLKAPAAPWLAPELIALSQSGERFRVFFDSRNGAIQGEARWFNWQRFLRQAHRHLMLPLTVGLTIVGLLAIPLIITLVSSFFIYRRWWRGFFCLPRLPRVRADGPVHHGAQQKRRFWGDLHRLIGVWSLWFVLLIAITSLWYLAERWGAAADYPAIRESLAATEDAETCALNTEQNLDLLIMSARAEFPELVVRSIRFMPDDNLTILQGQADAVLVRDRANHVAYGSGGALVDLRRGENFSWHARVSEAADPLHFGTLGGTPTRLIWAFFGLNLTLLVFSGVVIHGSRLVQRRQESPPSSAILLALASSRLLIVLPSATLIGVSLGLGVVSYFAQT